MPVFAFACILLLMALPAPAPASHVRLEPGMCYMGEQSGHGGTRVELQLLDDNFFSLREVFAPRGGRRVTRDSTGVWRQVEDGSLLRLTNGYGLSLRLNIGGEGNLYGEFSFRASLPPMSLTLKRVSRAVRPFVIMGRLERSEGRRASLTDSATGRVFSPVEGGALAALPPENPVFVDALVLPEAAGLRVETIRSFSPFMPESPPDSGGEDVARGFAGAAENQVWLLPELPGVTEASCFFSGMESGSGMLEVNGPGLRLVVSVEERPGRRLAFTLGEEDARMLRAAGFEELPGIFSGEYAWSREGGTLVLTASGRPDLLLEGRFRGRRDAVPDTSSHLKRMP